MQFNIHLIAALVQLDTSNMQNLLQVLASVNVTYAA